VALRPRGGGRMKRARDGTHKSGPPKKKPRSASFNPQASVVMRRKGEAKSYDGGYSGIVDASGFIYSLYQNYLSLTSIAQGTGDANYIGDSITPLYVTIRGLTDAADNVQALRVIVFQTLGNTAPTVATLMQYASGTIYSCLSPVKKNTRRQYQILRDKIYTTTTSGPAVRAFKIKIPMYGLQITEFTDAAGTIGTGGLYMLLMSDSTIPTHPQTRVLWRVTFTDS